VTSRDTLVVAYATASGEDGITNREGDRVDRLTDPRSAKRDFSWIKASGRTVELIRAIGSTVVLSVNGFSLGLGPRGGWSNAADGRITPVAVLLLTQTVCGGAS
jgi:hypothetical protein